MRRMLCIQSCGKPAYTGAFAPNHVLMFVQNPAFGYCAPPCVDEEKGLSRVKVFRTGRPAGCSYEGPSRSASKLFYSRLCILEWGSGAGCSEAVPEWALERFRGGFLRGSGGFRSRFRSGFWSRFRSGFPERVPEHFRSGSGAVSERVPRSLRLKPLCQAWQDAWSPKTGAYSLLCLMQS